MDAPQAWEQRWRKTTTFMEWRFWWWHNEVGDRRQQTACSLLHYLPDAAEYPFGRVVLSRRELPSRINEAEFWRVIYHLMATIFTAKLAIEAEDRLERRSGEDSQYNQSWREVGEDARKAFVALGDQGFWGFERWPEFFKGPFVHHATVQPTLDNVLNEVADVVILYWSDGRMWHRRRKPGVEVAFAMVKTAAALRRQLQGAEPGETLYRACINSGNLHLVRQSPTELGLQCCSAALESVVHTNISGHGYGKYVDDEGLEDPLKSMIFEMGLALGKTAEELKDLTTYHGIVYDDFA